MNSQSSEEKKEGQDRALGARAVGSISIKKITRENLYELLVTKIKHRSSILKFFSLS